MKNPRQLRLLALLLTLLPEYVTSQARGAGPAPAKPPVRVMSSYLTAPISLDAASLGPTFKGHDVTSLIADLKKSPDSAFKSEFETKAQYESRTQRLLESKARQYTFALDEFFLESTYDADGEILKISLTANDQLLSEEHLQKINGDEAFFSPGFALSLRTRSSSHYVATSRSGRKVDVLKTVFDEFGVVLKKDEGIFTDTGIAEHTDLYMAMKVGEAKALKPILRVAIICSLIDPSVFEADGHSTSPTIDSPRETATKQHYILVRPDELWVYESRSGRVIAKFVPNKPGEPAIRQ